MTDRRVAIAIIEKENHVLVVRDADDACAKRWTFPSCITEHASRVQDDLKEAVRQRYGIGLSTMWFLDSVGCTSNVPANEADLYVCMMLPSGSITDQDGTELCWVSRDELAVLPWSETDQHVARLIGIYWDQIFSSEHL